MKILLALLLFVGTNAHAGALQRHFHRLCETYLASEDPSELIAEVRTLSTPELYAHLNVLNQKTLRHGSARSWNALDVEAHERLHFEVIRNEIERRER